MSEEDIRQKYDFIMRPIKDLTKNWEVDVSEILQQYMCEIEKLSFTVNNSEMVINFAEASLLIQGTACVWSRKVEYLHMLVRKSLDMIGNKQSVPGQISLDAETSIDDCEYREEDKLLRLDDVSITSDRLVKGKQDLVSPFPIPPPSMLEVDADERGRIILVQGKTDAVSYSNDFWVNHYIPYYDGVSILDRDSKGSLHKIETDCPRVDSEENSPPVQMAEFDLQPDIHDDSMESINVNPEPSLRDEEQPEERQQEEIIKTMQLRQRLSRKTDTVPENSMPKLLDPYEDCAMPSWMTKKHRKVKSYRLPGIIENKSRKRKHDGPKQELVEPISDFFKNLTKSQKTAVDGKNPLLMIITQEEKLRNSAWKCIRNQAITSEQQNNSLLPCSDEVDHFDSDDECPDLSVCSEQYEHHENHAFGQENVDIDAMTNQPGSTYEDLVRVHVERFYSAAHRFKEETALAQRVKQWDGHVSPHLEEQSQRPVFDIHKYGDKIMKKFTSIKETRLFEDVIDSAYKWDVCRHFAATLQLVNDQNFSISKNSNFENSINTMALTLLSQQRLRDRFDDYTTET